MIKSKVGNIVNDDKNVTVTAVAKVSSPITLRHGLIGGGIVLAGIAYMITAAFHHGVHASSDAISQALSEMDKKISEIDHK